MKNEIAAQKAMQLATVRGGMPWICSVYYVLHEGRFYWLSFPERRHSQEIEDDPNVAIAIAIKTNKPVIGVQAEGEAHRVTDTAEVAATVALYVEKYGQGKDFVQRFMNGENKHALYRMTPQKVMLFDEYTSRKHPYRDITNNFR